MEILFKTKGETLCEGEINFYTVEKNLAKVSSTMLHWTTAISNGFFYRDLLQHKPVHLHGKKSNSLYFQHFLVLCGFCEIENSTGKSKTALVTLMKNLC